MNMATGRCARSSKKASRFFLQNKLCRERLRVESRARFAISRDEHDRPSFTAPVSGSMLGGGQEGRLQAWQQPAAQGRRLDLEGPP
jgi:hypothetical protein